MAINSLGCHRNQTYSKQWQPSYLIFIFTPNSFETFYAQQVARNQQNKKKFQADTAGRRVTTFDS